MLNNKKISKSGNSKQGVLMQVKDRANVSVYKKREATNKDISMIFEQQSYESTHDCQEAANDK